MGLIRTEPWTLITAAPQSAQCALKRLYIKDGHNYRAITHYFLTLDLKPRFLSIVADAILGVTIFGRKGVMMTHQKTPVASIGPLDGSYTDICLLVQHMNKIFEFVFSINTESHFIVVIVIICQILAIKNAWTTKTWRDVSSAPHIRRSWHSSADELALFWMLFTFPVFIYAMFCVVEVDLFVLFYLIVFAYVSISIWAAL